MFGLLLPLVCGPGVEAFAPCGSRVVPLEGAGVAALRKSPMVIKVYSQRIPSLPYTNCKGRDGCEYIALILVLTVSA